MESEHNNKKPSGTASDGMKYNQQPPVDKQKGRQKHRRKMKERKEGKEHEQPRPHKTLRFTNIQLDTSKTSYAL